MICEKCREKVITRATPGRALVVNTFIKCFQKGTNQMVQIMSQTCLTFCVTNMSQKIKTLLKLIKLRLLQKLSLREKEVKMGPSYDMRSHGEGGSSGVTN